MIIFRDEWTILIWRNYPFVVMFLDLISPVTTHYCFFLVLIKLNAKAFFEELISLNQFLSIQLGVLVYGEPPMVIDAMDMSGLWPILFC